MTIHANGPDIVYLSAAMKLSALLGRKFGVRVTFGGHPSTDGTEIILPFWDLSTVEARNALYGCVAHEAGGHVRMTDFDAVARACEKVQASYRVTFKSVLNILEDVRIEAALIREYRGVRLYLDAVAQRHLVSRPAEPDPSQYWAICLGWLLHMGRCELLRQTDLKGHLDTFETGILDRRILGPGDLAELRRLAAPVASLSGSRACTFQMIDAAMRVFDYLKAREQHQAQAAPQAQPQIPLPPQGGSGPESQQSDGDSSSQAPSDPQGGKDVPRGQSDPKPDGRASLEASALAKGTSSASGHSRDVGMKGQPTDATPLCREIGDVVGEAIRSEIRPVSRELMPLQGLGADPDHQKGVVNTVPVADFLRDGTGLIGHYVAGLAPLLVGEVHDDVSLRHGTRLDARRLARVVAEPDPAVFRRRVIDEDTAVAVYLLVDTSGSTKADDAKGQHTVHRHLLVSSLAMAGALEAFSDVDVAMACFPYRQDRTILTVKGLQTGLNGAAKALLPSGGTPMGPAMLQAGVSLLAAERSRRMLFVLTDGQPDCAEDAEQARMLLNKLGIEVYGLVIGKHAHYPREVFDDSVMVHAAASLPLALEKMVKRLI